MSEPVDFRYTPDGKDYTRALYAFYFSDKRTWLTVTVLVLLVICSSFAMFFANGLNQPLTWILPLFFFLMIVYIYGLTPVLAGRRVSRNPKLQSETTGTASSENLAMKNANVDSKVSWDNFTKAVETRDFFLLIYAVNRHMFQFIPKRAFASQEKIDAFRDLLNLYVTKK